MKIKSEIKISETNRNTFIEVLEKKGLTVSFENKTLKIKDLIRPNNNRLYLGFNPIINGEFDSYGWVIKIDSIIFKSFLFGLGCYIFLWANNAELSLRVIVSLILYLLNLGINKMIIKTRIENIESDLRKKI